jgi:hypothetical protein
LNNYTKSISQLLKTSADDSMGRLIQQSKQLAGINARLRAQLGSPLAEHVTLANISGNTAVLHVDSSPWLAKLHYLQPVLLEKLASYGVKRLQLKVKHHENQPVKKRPRRPALSKESAELLAATASSITDPALGQALMRLSKHQEKP